MRCGQVWLGIAATSALAFGCAWEGDRPKEWLRRMAPPWVAASDTCHIELAVVEEHRPAAYLGDSLWRETDELILPVEVRSRLEANGLRVGLVNGAGSAKLQRLLTQKDSCPLARRVTTAAEQEAIWPLRSSVPAVSLEVAQHGQPCRLELSQAEFGLALRLRPAPQDRTFVRFEPFVKHGDMPERLLSADAKREGWKLNDPERTEVRLPDLTWELPLGANDYLVVGGRGDRPSSFGGKAFVDEAKGMERSLVVRGVARANAARPTEANGPLPLAWQAISGGQGDGTPRGQSPER